MDEIDARMQMASELATRLVPLPDGVISATLILDFGDGTEAQADLYRIPQEPEIEQRPQAC